MKMTKLHIDKFIRMRLTSIKRYATINKSMLNQLSVANLFRFFCLSLFRNECYLVRIRLKDLAHATGEKETTLKNFNKDIRDIVNITPYYLPSEYPSIPVIRRNKYEIPSIATDYITLSSEFIYSDIEVKVKGYYIKLLLIAEENIISLSKKELARQLKIGDKTIDKYNLVLLQAGLLKPIKKEILLTPDNLLLDNDIAEQKRYMTTASLKITLGDGITLI